MPEDEKKTTESVSENTGTVIANTETVSDVVPGVSKIDFDSLTEEKVLSMTEFEVEEVKEQAKLYTSKADVLNGYLKALAWKAFKAKFTWANFKTLISSAWAKLKSWLSNLDPIFRYAIYALILAKLFNLI
jgi:hypothetical protein